MIDKMKFYTVAEVADILSISITTIHRYIKSGELEAYQIAGNGPWRFKPSVVEKFVEDCQKNEG